MEFDLRNGVYTPKAPEIEDKLACEPGYCARYARMVSSKILIGSEKDNSRLWNPSHGWNFHYVNRSVWTPERGVLDFKQLKEGQIIGVRIPYSSYNEQRDIFRNYARYSHLATVLGNFYDGGQISPWIAHNIYGVGDPESLHKFLIRTGSIVMEVFSPKT